MMRCAGPKAQLEGRDGWSERENSPVAGHTELSYDVTPLVQPSQRLIFTFTSNGVGHSYVFANP